MADPRYEIDWSADLSPALALLGQSRRAKEQEKRANAYLELQANAQAKSEQRASNEAARQAERDKYMRSVEAFKAFPELARMASRPGGEGAANTNPFGYKFEAHNDLPANVEGPELSPTAEAARFMLGAPKAGVAQSAPVQAEAPQVQPEPDVPDSVFSEDSGGPQMPPEGPRNVIKIDEPFVIDNKPEPTSDQPILMQAAAKSFEPGPEGKRRVFANYQGNRFELPEQRDTLGLGEEYDTIYRNLLASGEDEDAARKYVLSEHRSAQTQENIAKRTAANTAALIQGRDTSREDQQRFQAEQDEKYRRTFEQAMSLARAAAMRVDPSGGASPAVMAALADYAIKNPGDIGGLYREADRLHAPAPGKAVTSVAGATKPTEGQSKDARQATIGLRAVDEIERGGYTPSREDVQKWLNNQRLTYAAGSPGLKGALFTIGQNLGAVPQSEVEGLSDPARKYFGSVRRYMETIGRAQSGAAISPTEWDNFFNQYGPNSAGGLAAARQYLADQFQVSGVAGRQLNARTGGGSDMVTIEDDKGNRKRVTRDEARRLGAIK